MKQLDPWVVVVDGEVVERHPNREAARRAAGAIRRHPSTRDDVTFRGKGVVRVWRLSVWEAEQAEDDFHAPRVGP